MKKILLSTLMLAFILYSYVVDAQNNIMFFKRAKVHIIGEYDGSVVKLRIAPADIENWEYGIKHGYKIERITIVNDGVTLSHEDVVNSKIVLVDHLKPVSEEEWDNTVEQNDNSKVAKAMLYGDDFKVMDVNALEFDKAYNVNDEKENRYSFSLYSAEQSYDLALNMGLGYTDSDIVGNSEYTYMVVPSDLESYGNSVYKGYAKISTDNNAELLTPQNLIVQPGDSIIYLSWEQGGLDRKFTSFDIERSEDGVNFEKINDLPVVSANENGNNDTVYYVDSLDNNTTEYFYRVSGRTTFGETGTYSEIVSGTGVKSPYEMATIVDSIRETDNGEMKIYWRTQLNDDKVSGYNIYRSNKDDGEFELLNPNPLSATQNTFVDTNPKASNYYYIETIDINGNTEKTISYLGQPLDTEPPAPPILISATCNKSGVITIKWEENNEPDLEGYRIYTSYNKDEEFSIVGTTKNTEFIYDISLVTLSRTIYFKLVAEDVRENYSDFSNLIEVDIPDIIPPDRPTILEAKPDQNKIKIKWLVSTSDDLLEHELLRKKINTNVWDTIYVLKSVEGKSFSYFDNSVQGRQKYVYVVIAIDKTGNVSYSREVEVSMLDSGERGKITNFDIVKRVLNREEISNVLSVNSVAELKLNANNDLDTMLHSDYRNVVIGWDYNYPEDLLGFSVFRSSNNAPFTRYKFYTIKELFGVDSWEEIPVDNGLIHCIAFDFDAKVNSVLKYKVRAVHDYGGYSQFSKIRYINIWGFDKTREITTGDGGLGH